MTPKLLFILGLASAVTFAATLTRLPPDFLYPLGEESPGQVTFKHETHVDPDRPDCTTCHPQVWRITEPNATADGRPENHERWDNGETCGACHDGKRSFKMSRCDRCHIDPELEEEEEDE